MEHGLLHGFSIAGPQSVVSSEAALTFNKNFSLWPLAFSLSPYGSKAGYKS